MIGVTEFAAGLGVLAVQLRHPLAPAEVHAFHLALGDETDAGEWLAFVKVAVKRNGWKFLPNVTEILDALREFRGASPILVEATAAYERVLASSVYYPAAGGVWTYAGVRGACGDAAAEAWQASGGSDAWATTYREGERRAKFIEHYTRAVREDPGSALLPAGPSRPQLGAGNEQEALDARRHEGPA